MKFEKAHTGTGEVKEWQRQGIEREKELPMIMNETLSLFLPADFRSIPSSWGLECVSLLSTSPGKGQGHSHGFWKGEGEGEKAEGRKPRGTKEVTWPDGVAKQSRGLRHCGRSAWPNGLFVAWSRSPFTGFVQVFGFRWGWRESEVVVVTKYGGFQQRVGYT